MNSTITSNSRKMRTRHKLKLTTWKAHGSPTMDTKKGQPNKQSDSKEKEKDAGQQNVNVKIEKQDKRNV